LRLTILNRIYSVLTECIHRSYSSRTSDLIIWKFCFVVRSLFQTNQNGVHDDPNDDPCHFLKIAVHFS